MSNTFTPSQLRRTTSSRIPLDTPTPAPSSGHSSMLTSIKPTRSRSALSSEHPIPSRASKSPLTSNRIPQRAPLGPSSLARHINIPSDLNTQDLDLDNLEIPTDNTELERRNIESALRQGIARLEHDRESDPSLSSDHDDSVGFGDMSDLDGEGGGGRRSGFANRMEDQGSQSGSESLGDDFSLRIGMTGTRHTLNNNNQKYAPTLSSEDDEEERDLTYLTLDRTLTPPHNPLPPRQTAAQLPGAGRGLGREFERINQQTAATASARGSVNPPSSSVNAARQIFGDVGNTGARRASPSPLFGNAANNNSKTTTIPSPRLQPSLSKSPPPLVFINSSVPRFPPASKPASNRPTPANNSARNEFSRMRLPDITGLTEGLQSPGKGLGHIPVGDAASVAEGAVLSGALEQLRKRLASLERENSLSAARVRELESRLEEDGQQHEEQYLRQEQRNPTEETNGSEWERKLKLEQDKREALEALVSRLRSHVTHLTHSLEDHSATLSALRSAPPPAAPTSQHFERDEELIEDVAALRAGLEGLGVEVGDVKQVVDELVREREVGRQWEREEEERRNEMDKSAELMEGLARRNANQQQERQGRSPVPPTIPMQSKTFGDARGGMGGLRDNEDVDWTPRPQRGTKKWTGPNTPKTGRSFLDTEEIERLRREIAREEARRSPTPRPRTRVVQPEEIGKSYHRHQYSEVPARPATAPPSRPVPIHFPRQYASYDSSSAMSPSSVSRSAKGRRANEYQGPTETEEEDLREDFARAEEIFRSVSAPKKENVAGSDMCSVCRRRRKEGAVPGSAPAKLQENEYDAGDESYLEAQREKERERNTRKSQRQQQQPAKVEQEERQDPRTALENVLKDLEADFELHKRIYIELSDQYRSMDSKANGAKRKTLADHLKESIDTLELKADQVKRLHDLLHSSASTPPSLARGTTAPYGLGRMPEGII